MFFRLIFQPTTAGETRQQARQRIIGTLCNANPHTHFRANSGPHS
jgi:hypothetical protein